MRVSFVRVPWADSQPRCLALQRKGSSQNTTLAAGEWNRQVRTCGLTTLTRRLHELFDT